MANGDEFDPNPPGTMTGLGLSPDDPLYDWGSNMKPSDLQQYVHDPEGFKQNMINSGQPPPDHNYVQGAQGLQAVDQKGLPIIRQKRDGTISGNITSPLEPTSQRLGFAGTEAGDTEDQWTKDQGKPLPPPNPNSPIARFNRWRNPNDPNNLPAPVPAPAPAPVPAQATPPGSIPLPQARPAAADSGQTDTGDVVKEGGSGASPADKLKAAEKEKAKADKKVEAYSGEAMSDFAKSLQGVQVPKRPQLPGVGTPGVRSPVGIQPGISNLLALAGQGHPSPQQVALMKLLGRA